MIMYQWLRLPATHTTPLHHKKLLKTEAGYDYNPTTHSFVPKAGKVFIFRTADGHYAKMELLSVGYEPFVGPDTGKADL